MTTATATAARQPRRNLWRHADFMKLWSAATVSSVGDEITQLALPTVAILTLNATPFEFGLLGTIQFLPFILLTLPAGAWVDRLQRRPILIIGDLGRAAALASIPIAFVLGALTIWQLYIVGFVVGCLTVFFDVAYQSYLPALVDRDQLVDGNSKLEVSRSSVQIAGPGTAGVIIGLITAPLAILADAASFLGSALFVFSIRKKEPPVSRHVDEHGEKRRSMRQDVAEGLRYVLGHRYLRWIAACTATSNFFTNLGFAVILIYAYREVGLTPATVGFAFSIGNVGVLVAALLSSRVPRWIGTGPAIVWSTIVFAPSLLLIAIAPKDTFVPFFIASGLLGGAGSVVYNVTQVSFRQAITPERMQGRMNATMRFIVWGTIPIGSLAGGALATVFDLRTAIWVAAIGALLAVPPVLFTPVRSIREIPEPEQPGAPAGDEATDDQAPARARDAGLASIGPGGPDAVPTDDEPGRD
ncbi:MAG: MFS transporter [Chloroflexota bacterium]|nr:MFS transporter [Chloroflexota bacterium]